MREAHRRSLWQVVGIYVAGSWIALQVVDLLVDNFGLPPWLPPFALALLVIGLPVVVATAFVQEGIGDRHAAPSDVAHAADAGLHEDRAAEGAPTRPDGATSATAHRLFTWKNAFGGGVGALALWGVIAAGWVLVGPGHADEARAPGAGAAAESGAAFRSIAVLPFATRSTREEDSYFAEGMHDDLLTQLSRIDSLTVISRTSVMQYAGTTKTIGAIAGELGVATVLEGGVQRAGDRVRVNVQLIDAATDRHLWAETYDEELTAENIFAIQSDLAHKIAAALRATLSPSVEQRLDLRPPASVEAYDLYTRAQYALRTRGIVGQELPQIRTMFERALAADSGYAPSWVGLARTYLASWNWQLMTPAEAAPPARAALQKALALDVDLADAYLAMGTVHQFEGRLPAADAAMRRALELNPGWAPAHASYATLRQLMGDAEGAEREARRAIELDPLDLQARLGLADRLFFAGRFEESLDETSRVIEMDSTRWYAWYNVGWAASMLGRHEEALHAFREALGYATDRAPLHAGLAYAFARAGARDSALYYVGLEANPFGYDASLVYYELGDVEPAFRTLERALEADPGQLDRLLGDPSAADLLADPRFDALLGRLGLSRDR